MLSSAGTNLKWIDKNKQFIAFIQVEEAFEGNMLKRKLFLFYFSPFNFEYQVFCADSVAIIIPPRYFYWLKTLFFCEFLVGHNLLLVPGKWQRDIIFISILFVCQICSSKNTFYASDTGENEIAFQYTIIYHEFHRQINLSTWEIPFRLIAMLSKWMAPLRCTNIRSFSFASTIFSFFFVRSGTVC